MRYGFIAALAALCGCSCARAGQGRRRAQGRQGPLSDERLSGGYGAAGRDLDDQSAAAELRFGAGAAQALSVAGVPAGWTATLMGGGQPVGAAMPATNSSVSLELRLDVPKTAPIGTQTLTVTAAGDATNRRCSCRSRSRSPRICRPS